MGKQSQITTDMEHCIVCGNPEIQIHHIFAGTGRRKISDQYGYIVPLCMEHHTGNTGVHFNRQLDVSLKKLAQEHFEAVNGSRDDFRRLFGKSYL